ncbi:DEAD/DEAH box helicase family protein [Gammaproteobacteria bacterium]|nr:DEAD/DEAH box helicase family protein [Gammaproteobacteria bacterium]
MKIKYKKQAYQSLAVDAVVECFNGQPYDAGTNYRIDPGQPFAYSQDYVQRSFIEDVGFKNADIRLSETQILENIRASQRRQNLPQSNSLVESRISQINLDIEMETGTGKTFCYIKTMFEMHLKFGWSKFIVVVPSIAIREGVKKSLEMTAEYFQEEYHRKAKFFIYNSKQLHNLESFSSDAGINVMVINVQAFNATGKDNRRIYEALDDFQSRRPIDVIKANRPILILDEPQKMEGEKTLDSFKQFNPLFILRYSATHKTQHNRVYRLDALDAYNQKLVKKIAVRGITTKGLAGTNAYLYLETIEVSKQSPVARIELEIEQNSGPKRTFRRLQRGDNLYDVSGEMAQYKGFVISEINANTDSVEFTNGQILMAGEATGDVNEKFLRRIQIREAIKSHLEKERMLFVQGIKVLTLFFIDEVAKYRLYDESGEQVGEYGKIFEEEYALALTELEQDFSLQESYRLYLGGILASETHKGYFSIDKKSKRIIDSKLTATEKKRGESTDVDAYDLILKDKERLLSFDEPTRFIFSHSALREGWDNPNVFVVCTLKHSDNTISRRQEVGRGLRIAVNQFGDRQDDPATVHETNVLTVVASESYKDFVKALQKDVSDSLSERPRFAEAKYFAGKLLLVPSGIIEISQNMADGIEYYLIKNGYVDRKKLITQSYIDAASSQGLASLPEDLEPYKEQIQQLIDSIYTDAKLPSFVDDRGTKINPLNDNFDKREFKELWNRINQKAVYSVQFDSAELIRKCVSAINSDLRVKKLQYIIHSGEQTAEQTNEQIRAGDGFEVRETRTEYDDNSIHSAVKYDLVGKISEGSQLTRKTIAAILSSIEAAIFNQFRINPENFVAKAIQLIQEQKASVIVEHLSYDSLTEIYDTDIFTDNQSKQEFSKAGQPLKRHIYDYVVTDSKIERAFVADLDTSSEVVVYAKLPKGFAIPTPVGSYNPDWAISFKEGSVKHIYFVAETKGSLSSMQLRGIEKIKIACAKKYFSEISKKIIDNQVKYDVITDYGKLLDIVS